MNPITPPTLKPFVQSLGLRPAFWSRHTLVPKWSVLPGGIVEWNYTRKPNQLGAT